MNNIRIFRLNNTYLLVGLFFMLGFCCAEGFSTVFTNRQLSEVVFENLSGVGVRTIQISYVSTAEDGDMEIEISPSQESILHAGFYLSSDADFTVEASLTDGTVVYGQYDSLSPGGTAYMRLTESRIEKH